MIGLWDAVLNRLCGDVRLIPRCSAYWIEPDGARFWCNGPPHSENEPHVARWPEGDEMRRPTPDCVVMS